MEMRLRSNANVIVTNSKGELLVVELKRGPYAGGICIPGGGIEPGESSSDTAMREVREEANIEIRDVKPFGFCELFNKDAGQHRIVLLLEAKAEGTPHTEEETKAYWLDIEEAERRAIEFTREALRIWKEGSVHFTLTE